jgi:UDP-glucose 4-epimerase
METWLVTGAAGFLGSHVIEKLVATDKKIIALDNLSWGHKDFIESYSKKYKGQLDFYQIDLRNFSELSAMIEKTKPTHVIHLAALHFIPAAIKNPSMAVDINVLGTQNLLQALREKSSVKALWMASTGDVYAPDEKPHHEQNSTIAPFNIYGLSKLMCEQLIHLEDRNTADTRFIIGRLFNLYGARETNPHILPEIIEQIKKNKGDITLNLGNVWPKRDMVPVDEAAQCIIESVVKVSDSPKKVYCMNYATGNAVSMEEMIMAISKILNRKIVIQPDPAKIRSVERAHLQADVQSLKNFIGKTPGSDLINGLTKLLKAEQLIPNTDL